MLSPAFAYKNSKPTLREQVVGTWKLVSIGAKLADGRTAPDPQFGSDAIGYMVYDSAGHICTQVMNNHRFDWHQPANPQPHEAKAAMEGYEAYCGTWEVREDAGIMIHRKEMSLIPNAVGTEIQRQVSLARNRMVLSVTGETRNGPITLTYTWERVD